MRRLAASIALTLALLGAAAPPADGAPPGPAAAAPAAAPAPSSAEAERIYWWYYELNRQAEFRAAMARLTAWLEARERIACDGDTIPCWVVNRESGGDPRIWNGRCYAPFGWRGARAPNCPRALSSASGFGQVVRRTWGGYGGYLNAADAPVSVQNARIRQLWNEGGRPAAGCYHWKACRRR